jgi:radical SAM protein with 4Fe4S-binding SPASM domain
MDLTLFKKIIDDLYPYLLLILLWDWGEPFLNPQIYDMIKYARKRGVKLLSSTNGHVFANPSHARRIVASGLDALVFSVDGITQETYQYYRAGGHLDSVVKGIANVVAEKRHQKSQTPLLNFRFIVMKHNEYQVPLVEKFARSLGVDLLTFRKFFAVVNEENGPDRQAFFESSDSRHYRFKRSSAAPYPVKIEKNPCKNLWNCPAVHWNGDVCSCTSDYKGSHVFGNVNNKSFKAIWFGRSANKLRRDFRQLWQGIPLCKDCCYAFEGGDMGRDSVSEAIFFND